MKELKKWLEERYQVNNALDTVECDGHTYTGYMYGNDECFDIDEFYQYFLTDDALLKMYFRIPDGCEDFGDIDYNNPYKVQDDDAQYWINNVI